MPIWAALPEQYRGVVHRLPDSGEVVTRPAMGHLALVAGWQDVAPLRGQCQMIYVEHGAGQTYVDREHDPSYSGSKGQRHRGVIGYIAPSQIVADRWEKPAVAVGCPKMDHLIGSDSPAVDPPTVCFAWHWDCKMVPEASSAWLHYERDFEEIILRFRAQGFRVVAHEHPKWRGEMTRRMRGFGLEILDWDEEVFEQANILIVDNSSLAPEMMLLGRPVVFLNAPQYRRDIEHGMRFWDWPMSHPTVDSSEELMAINLWDLIQPSYANAYSLEDTANEVYAFTDGKSSQRAADWIVDLLEAAL